MAETFLSARWENIIMANYEVDAYLLNPYLPSGVELDSFNNKVYVSLVGFMFKRTKLFGIPIPLLGTFEEINLRFYVKRIQGDTIKRGVVFINETVPYKPVAWLANKLYKEHYTAVPAKSSIIHTSSGKSIQYDWKINKRWNHIAVNADNKKEPMIPGGHEEFIFEHYYGYTKVNEHHSQEYKVEHPRWQVNKVHNYSIDCDFRSMYGKDFSFLSDSKPETVFLAEGSPVSVKWKRTSFNG
jgi:uncharacterized protein YqjF (DUF2071 family)